VDPDGNEIKVGTWYGRALAWLGVNNFEAKVQKQLNNIKGMSPSLNKMVTTLENSKITYSIKPVRERSDYKERVKKGAVNHNGYDKGSNTVFFDPNNEIGWENKKRTPEAGLAHELGHAENDENGKYVKFYKDKAEKGDVNEGLKGNQNEKNSIFRENEVRERMGDEKRSYNYYKVEE